METIYSRVEQHAGEEVCVLVGLYDKEVAFDIAGGKDEVWKWSDIEVTLPETDPHISIHRAE